MRLKVSTVLLVLALALAGWPGITRSCGMSCCEPATALEGGVQLTSEMSGCCFCSDAKGSCGWERATHEPKPLAAVSSEQHGKELSPENEKHLPAFLQAKLFRGALLPLRFSGNQTGPPLPLDSTTLFQVMLC